jgi:hypothetical protein
MLSWIIQNIGIVLSGAGVVLLGVLTFFARMSGEKAGAQKERAKQEHADRQAVDTISGVRNDAKNDSDEALDARLRKWQGQ